MLVLEATADRQGERDNDYHWCIDGELAYQQGIDCARPECGCDRGWAGFDSHRPTTTVRVTERPDLTVSDLAAQLAASMCKGGWIDTADPADSTVAMFVDEIVECANYFGEGAVLERQGDLVRRRRDPGEERQELLDLTEGLDERGPVAVLDVAAQCIADLGPGVEELCRNLRASGWYESSLLEKSIGWLQTGVGPESLLDPDTPQWLHELGSGVISAARRRNDEDSTSYLIELEVGGELAGTIQLRVDQDGRISNAFATDDPIDALSRLLTAVEPRHRDPYRRVLPRTAMRALLRARSAFDDNPTTEQRSNPWPRNRAFIDFVLAQFGELRT